MALATDSFDYDLPPDRIAQTPVEPRDSARLMVLDPVTGDSTHQHFLDLINYLAPGDILVTNDSRVIRARVFARKETGGQAEIFLLKSLPDPQWEVLVGGKRIRPGTRLIVEYEDEEIAAYVREDLGGPRRLIEFDRPIDTLLDEIGHTPLPPYIHQPLEDDERYQTIFSRIDGSSAAPTAGLHFTPELLIDLRRRGIQWAAVTLHIGLDTFKPIETPDVADHPIHAEWASISPQVAQQINQAKLAGGRVVAVGTTVVRTLETAALRSAGIMGSLRDASQMATGVCPWRPAAAFEGETDLFIYPGFEFRVVDTLITNFHLPRSSLLTLVSAFAGQELIRQAYEVAINEGYRFFSFGDAMLITRRK
jgi:S-adenosylmethionine:tRNA ribosyltransferase-isomerase